MDPRSANRRDSADRQCAMQRDSAVVAPGFEDDSLQHRLRTKSLVHRDCPQTSDPIVEQAGITEKNTTSGQRFCYPRSPKARDLGHPLFCAQFQIQSMPPAIVSLFFPEAHYQIASMACACSAADYVVGSRGSGSFLWKIGGCDTVRDRCDE